MKLTKKLTSLIAVSALGVAGMTAPMVSQAEVSSSATIASMYLWRGLDISDNKPAMSGDITYSHESGAYASLWISSEGTFDNSFETDWTVGFSGSVQDFGYDVGYYKIWYPENVDSSGDPVSFSDAAAEAYLGLSYKDFGFMLYTDAKSPNTYKYYTLSYSYGAFSGTFGVNDDDDDNNDYKHLDLSYAATDRLSFTVSKVTSLGGGGTTPNPLFMLSYTLPVDLK
jgi:uncharacterized protein (TIGR02001 family)